MPAIAWPPMVDEMPRRHRRAWRGSVRARTTGMAVAVVGVTLLLGAAGLVASFHEVLERELRSAVAVQAAEAAATADAGGDPAAALAGDDDRVLQVLSPSGEVLSATPNAAGLPPLVRLSPGAAREVNVSFDDDAFLVVAAAAGDGRVVLVGHSLDGVGGSTRAPAVLLALALPALLVVVGATAWRAIGRALAPVDAMIAEADEITAARLDRRVSRPPFPDEVGRLADTLNRMLDRLERARERERRFIADASHELRSPIAAIRQHAEVTLAHPAAVPAVALARTAHAESLRMQTLVDDLLLLLAQADEQRIPLRRAPVDLDDIVLAEARRLRQGHDRLTVDGGGVSAARVDGDPAALLRVLRNIGDNATRHARHRVAFGLSEQDGWAVSYVDDDGTGVPAGDRDRVFDRFVRLDDARDRAGGGSGLGLAIVAEIVAAHGGHVAIEDSPLGGARVTVHLPLAAEQTVGFRPRHPGTANPRGESAGRDVGPSRGNLQRHKGALRPALHAGARRLVAAEEPAQKDRQAVPPAGSVPNGELPSHAVERLRDLVRRAILARICLGAGATPLWPINGESDDQVDAALVDDAGRAAWQSAWHQTLASIDALGSVERPVAD